MSRLQNMNIDAQTLVKDLQNSMAHPEEVAKVLPALSLREFQTLLAEALITVESSDETADHTWLRPICESLSQRIVKTTSSNDSDTDGPESEEVALAETIAKLYAALGPHHTPRYQLLTCLAQMGTRNASGNKTKKSLSLLAEKMVNDPPVGIGPAAAPLVHLCRVQPAEAIDALYPKLLDALANPEVAPAVLDLANFFARTGQTAVHPASSRIEGLLRLAEAVVAGLEPIQDGVVEDGQELRARQERVARSLPLAISLCDTLGLIGDDRAAPTLQRIGELQHRRLRVEAATARVRLAMRKEHEVELENASNDLVALAAEASVRMRVIAYAEELDLADQLPEEFDNPAARAEGELVAYLAQPTQMGLPPVRCELVDSKTLYWPSFEEPRNCYLFRFEYIVQAPNALSATEEPTTYANLGIAGPMVQALHTDLTDLPTEDVYATFAGWQAEHADIRHQEIDPFAELSLLPAAVQELVSRAPEDFTNVQPRIFGLFFEQPVVIATAQKGTAIGALVIDDQMHEPQWYPMINERSVGPGEAWLIYKGRRLLDSFNDDWTEGE